MVDDRVKAIRHFYIPKNAVHEAVEFSSIGDHPYGIVSHLCYLVDEAGYQSVFRGIVDETGTVINAQPSVSTDIKTSFAVLKNGAGPVIDEPILRSVAGKKILLCIQALDTDNEV
jgi:hypothetical protein